MEVIVFLGMSLDGFIARPDGAVDFLEPDDPEALGGDDMGFGALMARVDALLMGRSTYDFVVGSGFDWPYGDTPVFVATHRPFDVPEALSAVVEPVAGAPGELVEQLSERGVDAVYLDGGDLVRQFLAAGLVDEFCATIVPRLIGSGIAPFGPLGADLGLEHQRTTTYPGGFVQLTYRLPRPGAVQAG